MDIREIRKDFPMLNRHQSSFIYLDNAATTYKPETVIRRISRFYEYEYANIHRGNYPLSIRASQLYESARTAVKEWIDAEYSEEIVFTKGCTESINLAASSIFETWITPGDNVVVTELEHSSNFFPWKHHCERYSVQFRLAPAKKNGFLDIDDVLSRIDQNTRLVAITAMSNVTGQRPALEKIISKAHKNNCLVLLDGAQAISHQILSVRNLQCDFLCFSGHKIYGPMGIGVLYGKRSHLRAMTPYLYGGGMVINTPDGEFTYPETAEKFEAGTQNLAGALGLEAALCYLKSAEFSHLVRYEKTLAAALKKQLERIDGIRLLGPDSDSPILIFESEYLGAYDLSVLLANHGVAVRCGAHCAYPLTKRMGKRSFCRISLAFYNTMEEVSNTADILETICRRWKP